MLSSILLALPLAAAPEDLAKRYPGKTGWVQSGLSWTCGPEDVWELKSFALTFGKDFELTAGKSNVALGVHEGNVVWAVVFPEQPAKLRARGQPGDGEQAVSIFLQFRPGEIGRVFPSKTVVGPGDAWLRARATRIFQRKVTASRWSTPAGNPTIVPEAFTLVDIEGPTPSSGEEGGARRVYELDGASGKLSYIADWESKRLPPLRTIAGKEAEKAFDEVWQAFDREYANFVLLPKLDWEKLGQSSRKSLERVRTTLELGGVLADMLAKLEDLHVWVQVGDDFVPGYSRPRPQNGNWDGSFFVLDGGRNDTEHDLVWARTKDGIGYLNVPELSDAELPRVFDEALEKLADTWGLVLDLRFNGGGDEPLAQALAGRFVDQERVYSKNQYRIGPGHDQLGEVSERKVAPRGPWRYESPVVVLWGQKTMSSAESFALMMAQCPQVTTMGDRTAGSSGNPRRIELECGLTVNLPRWHDMDPAGKPLEHAGIEPEVKLDFPPEKFTERTDPVLEAALARLRKTPAGQRKPGKR